MAWTRARDRLVLTSLPEKLTDGVLSVLIDGSGQALISEPEDGSAVWAGEAMQGL